MSIPQVAYANMAAPKQADIVATYKMKNTTDESISTQSMFLSPNIGNVILDYDSLTVSKNSEVQELPLFMTYMGVGESDIRIYIQHK